MLAVTGKVILSLKKTLIHKRVHVVANCVVQRCGDEVVVRNATSKELLLILPFLLLRGFDRPGSAARQV